MTNKINIERIKQLKFQRELWKDSASKDLFNQYLQDHVNAIKAK